MKLTIGMAVAGDFYGPFYTIQHLRITNPEILDDIEILVVDNVGDEQLKNFVQSVPNAKYVLYTEVKGTAAPRNRVFAEASGEYVMCLDSHVMLPPGALKRFIEYMDSRGPGCRDLLQGPLWYDNLGERSVETHMAPFAYDDDNGNMVPLGILQKPDGLKNLRLAWRGEMFGIWCGDERGKDPEAEPFEIPMQGLGLFACRRDAWVGFNEHFKGFGGEEGYIHEKFRKLGGKCLCLPFLRWWHSFWRVGNVIPYRCDKLDKLRNYMIVAAELGISDEPAVKHFTKEIQGPLEQWMVEKTRAEVAALGIQVVALPKPAPEMLPPLVSCVCVTYGRNKMLAEMVGCFISQDYANRELVILNTHPVAIEDDSWPESIRITNLADDGKTRSLGELRQIALSYAKGQIIQHWDDDDWYLPWHISTGVAGLIGNPGCGFKPEEHWFDHIGQSLSLESNVVECSATYWREAITGYDVDCPAGQEQLKFIQQLQKTGKLIQKSLGPWNPYVYRWGQPGVAHVSAVAGETWQESITRWRESNQDTSPLSRQWMGIPHEEITRLAAGVHYLDRAEWTSRALSEPTGLGKAILTQAAFNIRPDAACLVEGDATETGDLLNMFQRVYSFNPEDTTVANDRLTVSTGECKTCVFQGNRIDFLYLGSSNPVTNLVYLRKLAPVFGPACRIACSASSLVWAMLAPTHRHERRGGLDVFTPRTIPRWLQFNPNVI